MKTAYETAACPVCGGTDSTEIADQIAIEGELAELWEFHTRRMRPTTDPRDLTDRVAFSQAPPLRVAQCNACSHIYRNPREREITGLYGTEAVDADALEGLFHLQRRTFALQAERLGDIVPSRANGLEIGSYVGAFLDAARQAGWQFEGRDVNPAAVAFARGKGLDVDVGSIGDVDTNDRFDIICIWNCFEQLADVRAAIRSAWSLLHEKGVLTIRVPNAEYWARLRRHRGPLRAAVVAALAQNNLLSFPYRNGFTPASLRTLCERNGFEIIRAFNAFSLPTGSAGAPWWAGLEARAVHRMFGVLRPATGAPWIEIYARRR